MRYEHLEFDLSTAACSLLLDYLNRHDFTNLADGPRVELENIRSEIRSRLQRHDQDPQVQLTLDSDDWLAGS